MPYVDFDADRFEHDVGLVNRRAQILPVSATRGDGLDEWLDWLAPTRQVAATLTT